MVAAIGMFFPDLFGRFDGFLSPSLNLKFSDVPSTIDAIYKVPTEGWLQIFALAGALEAKNLFFPTDYGYPPFLGQIGKLSKEEKEKKLLAEINNGRLAMMSMAAIVTQNAVTGQSLVEQFSTGNLNPWIGGYAHAKRTSNVVMHAYGDNRDFLPEAAKGVSLALPWAPAPKSLQNDPLGEYIGDVGFDPLGFSTNKRLLPWYREAELAHGRVSMLATLGYTVQVSGLKLEPFITKYPTSSEDPLLAATQVPLGGWLQIILLITFTEVWRYQNVIAKEGVA